MHECTHEFAVHLLCIFIRILARKHIPHEHTFLPPPFDHSYHLHLVACPSNTRALQRQTKQPHACTHYICSAKSTRQRTQHTRLGHTGREAKQSQSYFLAQMLATRWHCIVLVLVLESPCRRDSATLASLSVFRSSKPAPNEQPNESPF